MGIEKELSQMCAMIESGKLCYADAVYYLNLMRKKYGIWEKEFRQIYDVWSQKGELSGELDRHRDRAEDEAKKDPCRGYVGFYPELPGCIGYGKDKEMLRENMKESLEKWVRAGYEQWRERWIMGGCEKLEGLF